jgi:hypothetical protein
MDKISRRHPQFNRTLLCLYFANEGLKCHELLVQVTSWIWIFAFYRHGGFAYQNGLSPARSRLGPPLSFNLNSQ